MTRIWRCDIICRSGREDRSDGKVNLPPRFLREARKRLGKNFCSLKIVLRANERSVPPVLGGEGAKEIKVCDRRKGVHAAGDRQGNEEKSQFFSIWAQTEVDGP